MKNKIKKASLLIALATILGINTLNAKEAPNIPLDMNMDVLIEGGDLDPQDRDTHSSSSDQTPRAETTYQDFEEE